MPRPLLSVAWTFSVLEPRGWKEMGDFYLPFFTMRKSKGKLSLPKEIRAAFYSQLVHAVEKRWIMNYNPHLLRLTAHEDENPLGQRQQWVRVHGNMASGLARERIIARFHTEYEPRQL